MLLPFLPALATRARGAGFIVGIITNGSLLTDLAIERLIGAVDWIGVSIDALGTKANAALGRLVDGAPIPEDRYLAIAAAVRAAGIRLKINTVVNKINYRADFGEFVTRHRCARNFVVEDAEAMLGSYAMVDPCGRPYGNAGGSVRYGRSILEA